MKRIALILLLVLAATVDVASAVRPGRAPKAQMPGQKRYITPAERVDRTFLKAFKANDLEGIAKLYAPTATMYPTDSMAIQGKDGIRATWAKFFAENSVKDAKFMDTDYRGDQNLSSGWGRWSMTIAPKSGGAPATVEGRFTTVVMKFKEKEKNRIVNRWRYFVDHASLPSPPRAAAPAAAPAAEAPPAAQ